MDNEELLELHGWVIECHSPFEIYHSQTNSRATGWAATLVLEYLKEHPEPDDEDAAYDGPYDEELDEDEEE